jgi:hypothetical protein
VQREARAGSQPCVESHPATTWSSANFLLKTRYVSGMTLFPQRFRFRRPIKHITELLGFLKGLHFDIAAVIKSREILTKRILMYWLKWLFGIKLPWFLE